MKKETVICSRKLEKRQGTGNAAIHGLLRLGSLIKAPGQTPQDVVQLPPSIRKSLVFLLLAWTIIAGTFPVQAQSTGVFLDPIFSRLRCLRTHTCPHRQEIVVYQGQGQVCWSGEPQIMISRSRSGCTTSSTWVTFYDGDFVTFTASGQNGFRFDHWILPDHDISHSTPYYMSIPYSSVNGPMLAAFVA
jgi:hypothetical protein